MAARPPVRGGAVSLAVLGVVAVFGLGAGLWLSQTHTILYRVTSAQCDGRVVYSDEEGRRTTVQIDDSWDHGPLDVRHGTVANLVVNVTPDCTDGVRCEIVEDGVSVVNAGGRYGAACSAMTGR